MNNDTGIFISAYAGDRHQVENNLPIYLHHKCPVVILSPTDAPITEVSDSRVHCQWFGEKCWAGQKALVRHRLFLEAMLKFDFQWYLFNDADSVCLSAEIPQYLYQEKSCWSNEVLDLNPGKSKLPKIAVQPPYFFHRDVLSAMVANADNLPESYYEEVTGNPIPTECPDHYHLLLSTASGFPHKNYRDGASFETTSDHGLNVMAWHVRERGACMVHQVKTQQVLRRLVSEWQRRKIMRPQG